MGQFVIASGDATKMFHATDQTLNEIAVLVLIHIVFTRRVAVGARWDDRLGPPVPVIVCNKASESKASSRIMTMAIGWLSLGIAMLGLLRRLAPGLAPATNAASFYIGFGVAVLIVSSYVVAMRLSAPRG